jgi:WD40 repeat protein
VPDPEPSARDLVNDALDLTPGARAAFLARACGGDAELRAEVESLLDAFFAHRDLLGDHPTAPRGKELGTFGRYTLLAEIGRGGQATVYRARDPEIGRHVALKILAFPLAGGTPRERFLREAASVERLRHPGLCPLLEAGEIDGVPFLAMELIDGDSLADHLAAARQAGAAPPLALPPHAAPQGESGRTARVLHAFERLALALHHAHEQGLVHRDVKPGNVVLRPDGTPVLLDFGVARDLDPSVPTLTAPTEVVGTPYYIAPELLAGDRAAVDRRADVWSLGVALHECLTLERPFDAATRDGLYRRILAADPPDPRRALPQLPADLVTVLRTAMARAPAHRYQTARDLALDLARVRSGDRAHARRPPLAARAMAFAQRHPALAASAAGLAIALAIAILALLRVGAERTATAAALERVRTAGLVHAAADAGATDPRLALLLAREAVRRASTPDTLSQLQKALADLHERQLLGPHRGKPEDVAFSPTGERILTRTAAEVVLWNGAGDRIAELELADPNAAAFVPPGDRVLAGSRRGRARLFDRDGQPLTELAGSGAAVAAVAASADGARLAIATRDGEARVFDGGGRELARLTGHTAAVTSMAFAPGGALLVTGSADGTARIARTDGTHVAVLAGHGEPVQQVAVGAAGTIATRSARTVRLWSLVGNAVATLPPGLDWVHWLAWSPDGELLAVACADHTVGVFTKHGELLERLRGHRAPVEHVAFAPDGRRIACGSTDLTARVIATSGDTELVLRGHASAVAAVAFSPSGEQLVTASPDGTVRLWDLQVHELPVLGGHALGLYDAQVSPDGELVVTASRDATARLWTRSGRPVAELAGHGGMVFSAAFTAAGEVMTTCYDQTVRFFDRDGRELRALRRERGRFFGALDPTGAGRLLARDGWHAVELVAADGHTLARCGGHGGQVWWADFAPDGGSIATASDDGKARRFAADGQQLAELTGHTDRVRCARVSPSGRLVATASDDGTARVWRADGTPLATLIGHRAEVLYATFSPDEELVLTASRDATARVWRTDGTPVMVLAGHDGVVWSANFAPDGSVWTASSDKTARRWIVEPQALLELADRHARPFTPRERQRYADLTGR